MLCKEKLLLRSTAGSSTAHRGGSSDEAPRGSAQLFSASTIWVQGMGPKQGRAGETSHDQKGAAAILALWTGKKSRGPRPAWARKGELTTGPMFHPSIVFKKMTWE